MAGGRRQASARNKRKSRLMAERRHPLSARSLAKNALRHYGNLTSDWRSLPDFAIIGAKRGGTTSLYNYLLEHRSVMPLFPGLQRLKGVHYFDSEYWRGGDWYRSHFPLAVRGRHLRQPLDGRTVSGEASPYYLFHPLAAGRLAAEVPDIKLVVMLRDPVERAWSHYKERVRNGGEDLSFEEALDVEGGRLEGEVDRILGEPGYRSYAHENHSYVTQGRYSEMLERWFSLFDREQFFIAASEDFYRDPDKMANEVWSFLGLPGATLRSRQRHNYHPAPDLEPQTRARLSDVAAEEQAALEELLGRRLPWPYSRSATVTGRTPKKLPRLADPGDSEERAATGGGGGGGEPSVTVIIATRDRPQLLARAVGSVLAQDYAGPLECVVVFDQSDEEPVDVIVPEGRSVRTIRNMRTPGLAGARNSGILVSSSELIATCDDDDTWAPEKLRLQIALTTTNRCRDGVQWHAHRPR